MPTVFITGADRGLGLSLCRKFLSEDWRVFGGCYSSELEVEKLISEFPSKFSTVPLDIRDLESVRNAAFAVQEMSPSLDILINNAGINPSKDTLLEELNFDVITETINVNTLGPLRVTQQFFPLLEKGSMKRIANISSDAGSVKEDFYGKVWFGYSMSKAGLNMQTKKLRIYLGPKGFDVCAIHPGWMRSGISSDDATFSTDEAAESLFPLITKRENSDDDWYYQFDGNPLPY